PPSFTPRRFAATNASLVRREIIRRSSSAIIATISTVRPFVRHVGRDEIDVFEAKQEVRMILSRRHNGQFIAYYRVSTAKQGRSGLGIEAQQAAVERYLNGGNWK